jgi:hypothetical protein
MDPDTPPDCWECGQSAVVCRARQTTSGHAYIPKPEGAESAAVRRMPLIADSAASARDEAAS